MVSRGARLGHSSGLQRHQGLLPWVGPVGGVGGQDSNLHQQVQGATDLYRVQPSDHPHCDLEDPLSCLPPGHLPLPAAVWHGQVCRADWGVSARQVKANPGQAQEEDLPP